MFWVVQEEPTQTNTKISLPPKHTHTHNIEFKIFITTLISPSDIHHKKNKIIHLYSLVLIY